MKSETEENPYIRKIVTTEELLYNPNYGDDRICKCGHPYYRHFDTYEDMKAVGCKYCECYKFIEEEKIVNKNNNIFMHGLVICSCRGTVISTTGKVMYNHKENKVHCWTCNKEYDSDYAYSMRIENVTVQLDLSDLQKEEDI